MSFTTDDVRETLREKGPLTREELEGWLGIESMMKGSRVRLRAILDDQIKGGYIAKEEDGRFRYAGKPMKKQSKEEATRKVRAFLIENGPTSMTDLADGLEMWPNTILSALKRAGAAKIEGKPVRYYIPGGSE